MAAELKHAPKKRKLNIKAILVLLTVFVLVGVLSYSVYRFVSESVELNREQERFSELRDLIGEDEYGEEAPIEEGSESPAPVVTKSKYEALFNMNSDMQGWLKISGTAVDYPVMKNDLENGEYYLHRDFDGEYSFAGCLFIGKRCTASSDIFIIYGHNMKNGSMFACLTDFINRDFALQHREISFDTGDERRVYRVFAAFAARVYPNTEEYSDLFKYYESLGTVDEESYSRILDQYRSMSVLWMDDIPAYPDQIMLMSTCLTDKERFVVAAYRVK